MKTITITVEDEVLETGERIAVQQGTDLQEMVRSYLQHLADKKDVEEDAKEFVRLALERGGQSPEEYTFDRDEIHRRGGE